MSIYRHEVAVNHVLTALPMDDFSLFFVKRLLSLFHTWHAMVESSAMAGTLCVVLSRDDCCDLVDVEFWNKFLEVSFVRFVRPHRNRPYTVKRIRTKCCSLSRTDRMLSDPAHQLNNQDFPDNNPTKLKTTLRTIRWAPPIHKRI